MYLSLSLSLSLSPLGLPTLPTMITSSLVSISIRMRTDGFFLQCACVFDRRMAVACVLDIVKDLVAERRCFGLWQNSEALICCQDHVVILMFDETDLAQGLPWKLTTNRSSLEVYRTAEWVRRTVPLDILKQSEHHRTRLFLSCFFHVESTKIGAVVYLFRLLFLLYTSCLSSSSLY